MRNIIINIFIAIVVSLITAMVCKHYLIEQDKEQISNNNLGGSTQEQLDSSDNSEGRTDNSQNENDILTITRPTEFKVNQDNLNIGVVFYTDGSCTFKDYQFRNQREGHWRLIEESIHDENFRFIVYESKSSAGGSDYYCFTADNQCVLCAYSLIRRTVTDDQLAQQVYTSSKNNECRKYTVSYV